MRYLLALIVVAVAGGGGFLAYRYVSAGVPVDLPRPLALTVRADNSVVRPGEWKDAHVFTLSALAPKGVIAGADVEVRRVGMKLHGVPTATAKLKTTAGDPSVRVQLGTGVYHWQIRLHNSKGVSRWKIYHGTIRVDHNPPTAPKVSSSTDPVPMKLYHSSDMSFAWTSLDAQSGVVGYSYRLDHNSGGTAEPVIRTTATSVSLNGLTTGTWYFHVRARDAAGNWGKTATFPVKINVTPPAVTHVYFSRYMLDPQFNNLQLSFQLTRPAATVRAGVYLNGNLVRLYTLHDIAADKTVTVTWDGKNEQGNLGPSGNYDVYVRPIDRYGNTSLVGWHEIAVVYKRIVVSLSQQRLWAYDGKKLFLTSLVTTGNHALPTPMGTYSVQAKYHPYKFISPWPKSSPFYYAPSVVQWALYFRTGGYFIHDAPWRSVFGPGSNAQLGTPGNNYTGSHGCVNVPGNVAQELFAWTPEDTPVIIQN